MSPLEVVTVQIYWGSQWNEVSYGVSGQEGLRVTYRLQVSLGELADHLHFFVALLDLHQRVALLGDGGLFSRRERERERD